MVAATVSPSARPSGFGALVAGRTSAAGRAASVVILLGAVVAAGLALGGVAAAARGAAAAVAGLAVAALLRWTARRRLGGMTGDVFGAIIEPRAEGRRPGVVANPGLPDDPCLPEKPVAT